MQFCAIAVLAALACTVSGSKLRRDGASQLEKLVSQLQAVEGVSFGDDPAALVGADGSPAGAGAEVPVGGVGGDESEVQVFEPGRHGEFDQVLELLVSMKSRLETKVEETAHQEALAEKTLHEMEQRMTVLGKNLPALEQVIAGITQLRERDYPTPNSRDHPHSDCAQIKRLVPDSRSGVYWVTGIGGEQQHAFRVYCEMEKAGGGWTLILKNWANAPGVYHNPDALGEVEDGIKGNETWRGRPYKLSDENVRALVGPQRQFDVLADQVGFNGNYSKGNFEYVTISDYTGDWDFSKPVPPSSTPTTFRSYRASDHSMVWQGNLACGVGGGGINCHQVLDNNPKGGAGCTAALGTYTDVQLHHFFMSNDNPKHDTYLYICNGAQHSSDSDMSHRFYVRSQLTWNGGN